MCNHIWGWARAMAALESRSDRDDVQLYMDWPKLDGHILFPRTFTGPLPGDTSGFSRINPNDIGVCIGDCSIRNSWQIPVRNEQRIAHHMATIGFSDAIKGSVAGLDLSAPTVGVHIRYGSFVKAPKPVNCPHGVRAPNDYYSRLVDYFLEKHPMGKVFLASDGTGMELKWFTQRYRPQRVRSDLCPFLPAADLLALSRCRVIVGSESTFSHDASAIGGGVNMTWPHSAERDNLAYL